MSMHAHSAVPAVQRAAAAATATPAHALSPAHDGAKRALRGLPFAEQEAQLAPVQLKKGGEPKAPPAATPDPGDKQAQNGPAPDAATTQDATQDPTQDAPQAVDPAAALARLDRMLMLIGPIVDDEGVNLFDLVSWTEELAGTLETALQAVATADDATRTRIDTALGCTVTPAADELAMASESLKTGVLGLVNGSSLLKKDRKEDPKLPEQAEIKAFNAAAAMLMRLSVDKSMPADVGPTLIKAVVAAQDAALATLQGLSVLAARATWRKGKDNREDAEAREEDGRTELDDIFRDADYGNRTTGDSDKGKAVADWCGMFVGAHLFRGGGIDEELRAGMLHTSNVLDYFRYQQLANAKRAPKSIWADGRWHNLKEYHGGRGALRMWTPRETLAAALEGEGEATLDIRPGDVVLIDHSGKKASPQHITMVESYDPATRQLVTIEGNTNGIKANADGEVDRVDGEYAKQGRGADGSGLHTRDLETISKASAKKYGKSKGTGKRPKGAYKGAKGATVFGVGRPSIVDFEEHEYAAKAIPEQYLTLSPADMEKKAKEKGKGSRADKAERKLKKSVGLKKAK